MSQATEELHELHKQGRSNDFWNTWIMGRENVLFKSGLLFQWGMRASVNAMIRLVNKLTNFSKQINDLLEKYERLNARGLAHEINADFRRLEADIRFFLQNEKNQPNTVREAWKAMQTIEANMIEQFRAFEGYLEHIYGQGYTSDELQAALKNLKEILKKYAEDLKSIEDTWGIFAGEEKGFKLNRSVNNMQTLFQTGRIHQRWFIIPIFTRIGTMMDINKTTRYPPRFWKALKDAVKFEQSGDSAKVTKEDQLITRLLKDELQDFEKLQNDLDTYVNRFIEIDVDAVNKAQHLLARLKDKFPELHNLLMEFAKHMNNHQTEFADLIYSFRRGTETFVTQINGSIIPRIDDLLRKCDATSHNKDQVDRLIRSIPGVKHP